MQLRKISFEVQCPSVGKFSPVQCKEQHFPLKVIKWLDLDMADSMQLLAVTTIRTVKN